jgi:hypothetical protein
MGGHAGARAFTATGATLVCTVAAATIPFDAAHAQWTVTNLHPAGAVQSRAWSVRGGQQVGQAFYPIGISHAAIWSGSAASFVDLGTAVGTGAWARGLGSGQQCGVADNRGILWSGSASSWVDLTPAGANGSALYNMHGGHEVGWAFISSVPHASLWSGTPASWVDLQPPGAMDSAAQGVYAGQQVGYVNFVGQYHASLWNGTAASWVDLSPLGSTSSRALAVYDGRQVGWASFGGTNQYAGLWNGTAASWVNLNPAGAIGSTAFAVWAGRQAGWASVDNTVRAGIWSGTAASWEALPLVSGDQSWGGAYALSIWSDATSISVVGYGGNSATNRTEALLWTRPVCYANCDRSSAVPMLNIGDYVCFLSAFVAGDGYANCDGSTTSPVLNVQDFACFVSRFMAGCS